MENNISSTNLAMEDVTALERTSGSTLSYHHVRYTVQVRPPGKSCCGSVDKEILKDVSGMFPPGMNAIMGATGSGKTSLLDVMAGRKDPKGLVGDVLVDSAPQPKNFKCIAGYVVQDDVVMGTLTVRENLMFSANLRMSSDTTMDEKKEKLQDIINELGLAHCADQKVGNEFIRGVSGGERKRTNIGMELILSPSVLFLDEPTTGLDANTANSVMYLLKTLSRRGRTIVFSIHQPRYSIFKTFDRLVLLAKGKTVYQGPAMEALDYFSSIGFECEEHNNPPDFFLDIINGNSTALQDTDALKALGIDSKTNHKESEGMNGQDNGSAVVPMEEDEATNMIRVSEMLAKKFSNSPWQNKMEEDLNVIWKEFKSRENSGDVQVYRGDYARSFGAQVKYVILRSALNIMRNPQLLLLQLVISTILGVIVGLIFFQVDQSMESGIQNRVGAFFFVIMNQIFSNMSALDIFIQQRKIFVHEYASGYYTVEAFFVGKLLCDIIPLRLLPVTAMACVIYFLIGFQVAADKFFFFLLTLFLTNLCASSTAFFMSASVRVLGIANLLMAMIYIFMMLFGGFLANLGSILSWLSWLKWVSVFRYSMNALSINEMKDMAFCLSFNGTEICDPQGGNQYLESQGIPYETSWDLWQNEVALIGIMICFLVLAYIQLRRIPKYN